MRAAVFYDVEDIRLEDVPDPEIGDEDVLVEVAACGICGSDLEYYTGRSPIGTPDGKGPLILGHEFSGRVVQAGNGVNTLAEGDRVAVNPIQSSAGGDFSRSGAPHFDLSVVLGVTVNGGFAQYVRTRAEHAYRLPDSMTDEQGAFVEMLAASVNAIDKAEVRIGDLVVVYGPGPVGLSLVQLAKAKGGRVVIVGTRDYRLELARSMGADHAVNVADTASLYFSDDVPTAIREMNHGELADRAIVATAVQSAVQDALSVTGNGSTIVYLGLAGPEDTVHVPTLASLVMDKTIRFSWLYPNQWPSTIRLLREGIVDTSKIITHSIPLEQIDAGIRQVVAREDGVIKIVVKP
jgi:2-desacetyl-2-hydroxyethyl bacteriochlorophyllide A dehydrogenase